MDKNKILTDWKGNEIKPGMEVCLIKVIDRQYWRTGIIEPIAPGVHIENFEDKRPDIPCWEPRNEYFLVNEDMTIESTSDGATIRQPLEIAIQWADMQTHILAIKGISDKQE